MGRGDFIREAICIDEKSESFYCVRITQYETNNFAVCVLEDMSEFFGGFYTYPAIEAFTPNKDGVIYLGPDDNEPYFLWCSGTTSFCEEVNDLTTANEIYTQKVRSYQSSGYVIMDVTSQIIGRIIRRLEEKDGDIAEWPEKVVREKLLKYRGLLELFGSEQSST